MYRYFSKMVGYDRDTSKQRFHKQDYAIAGAASGFVTRVLFQPLDVIKIRFQLQIEPIIGHQNHNSKYRGILHAVKCIGMEEGMRAFWKGIVPAQLLSTSHGALQFLTFETLTQQASTHLTPKMQKDTKPLTNFTCGAISGFVATTGSLPFDVLRTRLVSQGEPKTYRGLLHGASVMLKTEGVRSFYKGLIPTLIQIMPNAGAQFAFYKLFLSIWQERELHEENSSPTVFQSICCGTAAGTLAKVIVYPLDLIKKRLQVQGFEEARKAFGRVRSYSGLLSCVFCIVREEGILGLYKGLCPSVLKAALTTGSHFLYYEQSLKVIAYFHRSI